MPHESARQVFYPGVLLILTFVYTARCATWALDPTPGRVAGVEWVSGWMTTDVVAIAWGVTAVSCAVGAVLSIMGRQQHRNLVITTGTIAVFIPLLIASYFVGSTVLWIINTFQSAPVNSPPLWYERGSQFGYITGIEYTAWAAVAAWSLMVHTGTVKMITRVCKAITRDFHHQGGGT